MPDGTAKPESLSALRRSKTGQNRVTVGDPRRSKRVQARFLAAARELVQYVQEALVSELSGKHRQAIENLTQDEVEKTVSAVTRAFEERKMGLRGLTNMAQKELAIFAVRKSTRKFTVDLMEGGIGPAEYFDRFYKESFQRFGIPANRIAVVDPNLHTQLKRHGQFANITKSLTQELSI